MKVEFSKHALIKIKKRKISKELVLNVLDKPDIVLMEGVIHTYQSVIKYNNKDVLLRVFVNINKDPNLIVTCYLTSKIEKYRSQK